MREIFRGRLKSALRCRGSCQLPLRPRRLAKLFCPSANKSIDAAPSASLNVFPVPRSTMVHPIPSAEFADCPVHMAEQRNRRPARRRDGETARRRDGETARRRDGETARRRDNRQQLFGWSFFAKVKPAFHLRAAQPGRDGTPCRPPGERQRGGRRSEFATSCRGGSCQLPLHAPTASLRSPRTARSAVPTTLVPKLPLGHALVGEAPLRPGRERLTRVTSCPARGSGASKTLAFPSRAWERGGSACPAPSSSPPPPRNPSQQNTNPQQRTD